MDPASIQAWLAVFSAAELVGGDLLDLIHNHAKTTLTPDEWNALASAWDADRNEAAKNAGIDPTTGQPIG